MNSSTSYPHLLDSSVLSEVESLIQVISSPLMEALKQSALDNGWSLNKEVVLRLLMTLNYPVNFGCSSLFDIIMTKKFTKEEIEAENKRKKEVWIKFFKGGAE